ncbi:YkoP family protein [Virgibacillus natechei]
MRSYLLGVWDMLDPIYHSCTRLHYVPENKAGNTLFRVRLTSYQGHDVILNDGTMIHKHDLLLKIHLHNVKILNELYAIDSDLKRAVFIYHKIKHALPSLANYMKTHRKNNQIKGIIGITSLYKGANRLGFELFPIKNAYYRAYKKFSFLPIHLIANTSQQDPVYLFMSKDALLNKYD